MSVSKLSLAAFDQGQKPMIACFNRATTPLGVDMDALIEAMQAYVDKHVAPVWGTPATLVKSKGFLPGHWALVFLDDADEANALGLHELTPDGFPLGKVFVRPILKTGEAVSVTASHELVEMLVDPAINMMTTGPEPGANVMYAYESADPVEALTFPVNGLPMSDFVYPSYFEAFRKPGSTRFDHLRKVQQPFEILEGGYQIVFENGRWDQRFASEAKRSYFRLEDRRRHRSEERLTPPVNRQASRPDNGTAGGAGRPFVKDVYSDAPGAPVIASLDDAWEREWHVKDGPTHVRRPGGGVGVFTLTKQVSGSVEFYVVDFQAGQMDEAWRGCWLLPRGQTPFVWNHEQLPPFSNGLQYNYQRAIDETLQKADTDTLRLEGEIKAGGKKEIVTLLLAPRAIVGDDDMLIITTRTYLQRFRTAPAKLAEGLAPDQDGTGHADPH